LSETTAAAFFRNYSPSVRRLPGKCLALRTSPSRTTEKDAELPVHRGAAAVIDGTERTFLDRYAITSGFRSCFSPDRFGRRLVASLFESG